MLQITAKYLSRDVSFYKDIIGPNGNLTSTEWLIRLNKSDK